MDCNSFSKKKIKTIFLTFIALVVFVSSNILAQNKVSGVVKSATNQPINDVQIYAKSGRFLATTNNNGKYEFTSEVKKMTLVFYAENYKIKEKVINLTTNNTVVNVSLNSLSYELSAVEIKAHKRKVFELTRLKDVVGTAIYAGKKSEVVLLGETMANKAANNARQIYSHVVGLNIYENDDAGLQLNIGGRGLDPNRTSNFNTRQNGYDISADVLGYPESYYTPPAEALEEIQVVRGAASLQYGTQFGGLLNFKFKKPNRNKKFELVTRQSVGSFGLFNTFNSVGGTVDNTGYYGYVNYKRGDGFRPNSAFNSINVYGHIDHKLSDKTTLTIEGTYLNYLAKQPGGLTDKMFKENPLQSNRFRNWFRVNWSLWSAKLEHNFTEDTKLSINLFGLDASRKAIGYRGNFRFPTLSPILVKDELLFDGKYDVRDVVDGNYQNWGVETRFLSNYQMGKNKNIYLLGIKYYQANNSEQQGQGSRGTDADFSIVNSDEYHASNFKFPNKNLAIFGEHIFKFSEKFTVTPGFRFEYIKTAANGTYKNISRDLAGNPLPGGVNLYSDNRTKERNFVLFGIGASYKPSKWFEAYINASQNYRSVTFNDIRTVSPSFIVDENITDEKGGTADIGIRGKWKNYLSYDISGYGLLYKKRIGVVLVDEGPNKGDRVRTNVGDARILGFESFVDVNLASILKFNNDYRLNVFNNLALTNSEYTNSPYRTVKGKKVEFVPDVNIKTGAKFGYKNFLGSIQFSHLSEQFSDASNAQADEVGGARDGLVGPIPAYSILDASFSYSYKKWKLETGINNLLNESYFTRRATGYPGPGIIPSAPRSYYVTLQFKL